MLYFTIRYDTILYCSILYYTIPYYIILYYTTLYCTRPYDTNLLKTRLKQTSRGGPWSEGLGAHDGRDDRSIISYGRGGHDGFIIKGLGGSGKVWGLTTGRPRRLYN